MIILLFQIHHDVRLLYRVQGTFDKFALFILHFDFLLYFLGTGTGSFEAIRTLLEPIPNLIHIKHE